MKKLFLLTALAVLVGVASASAQQIAVVSEGGETTVFQTLPQAIEGAAPGSVIYLPGGVHNISDEVKITKRLTIIGIGHKVNNDNVDGFTEICGNLWFNEGSSSSSVMGCFITGSVIIGEGDAEVNDILIKRNSLSSVQINNSYCRGTVINQNYIRDHSRLNWAGAFFSHNVMWDFSCVHGATFVNNVILCGVYFLNNVQYSVFTNNFIINGSTYGSNDGNTFYGNISHHQWGENDIVATNWDEIFVNFNGGQRSPNSDYHLTEDYQQYNNVGVYAGGVDFDHQVAPVPYIVAKRIAEETDPAGQLKIQVRVKAGE